MLRAIEIGRPKRFKGDARLYLLESGGPLPRYVVVSAVDALDSGDETLIFASDSSGRVRNFNDLDGSFRGEQDHAKALRNAGYEIVQTTTPSESEDTHVHGD